MAMHRREQVVQKGRDSVQGKGLRCRQEEEEGEYRMPGIKPGKQCKQASRIDHHATEENEGPEFYETQTENVFWLHPGSPAV